MDTLKLLKRTDKFVYGIIQTHGKPIGTKDLIAASELSERGLRRVLSRLRNMRLVRGFKDGQYTFYEDIA